MQTISRHVRSGFTLVEILIAIAIVVIMGAVAIPTYLSYKKKGEMTATQSVLKNIKLVIETGFSTDTGSLPETLQDLVTKPANEEIAKEWKGPYLEGKKALKDAWGSSIQYNLTPGGAHEFELYSYGPKKKSAPQAEWISVWDL